MALPHSSMIKTATKAVLTAGPLALIKALFHSHCIFIKDLTSKNVGGCSSKEANYVLKVVCASKQINELPTSTFASQFRPFNSQEIRARVNRGSLFFCAYVNGELAHTSWLVTNTTDRREIAPFNIHYPVEVNIESPFTDPKYRRLGLFSHTLREMCGLAATAGKTKVFMATLKSNEAVVASLSDAGFQIYREGPFWKLLIRNLLE